MLHPNIVDHVVVAGVVRLAVHAIIGAGGVFDEDDDDNAIAQGQTLLLGITENYIHNGTAWVRAQGGADNVAAGTANQGTFVAGLARSALPTYTDGDIALPTFDLAGRLMVNMGGIAVETDDDAVAAGADHETILPLNYGFDGTNWRRMQVRDFDAAADVAAALIGLVTNSRMSVYDYVGGWNLWYGDTPAGISGRSAAAVTAAYTASVTSGIDNTAAAVLRPVEARSMGGFDGSSVNLITLGTSSLVFGRSPVAGTISQIYGEAPAAVSGRGTGALVALYTHACVTGQDNTGAAVLRPVEARALSAGYASTLVGLVVNAMCDHLDLASSTIQQNGGDLASAISGRTAASARAMYGAAINVGIDNTGAAVLRPVEARLLSASIPQTAYGLVTNAVIKAVAGDTGNAEQIASYLLSSISGIAAASYRGLETFAAVVGIDNTAAAVVRPVEARNFDAAADVAAALIGLLVNSRPAIYSLNTSDWAIHVGDALAAVSGRSTAGINLAYQGAINLGVDNTGAAVLRPVEARNFDAAADVAAALVGLLVNSRPAIYDIMSGDWTMVTGVGADSTNLSQAARGFSVYQARADEFQAARRGRRFYSTHQTPGTLITAQTAFVATTPTLMYRINGGIRGIIRSLSLSVGNTPGGLVYVTVAIDTADRWDSGGTALTLQNSNEESATAAVGLMYFNPTANAAGAGTRYLGTWIVPGAEAANISLDFGDGILLGTTAATLLVYVWAATTAPQLTHVLDLEEVA